MKKRMFIYVILQDFCAEAIGKKVIFDLPSETEKKAIVLQLKLF